MDRDIFDSVISHLPTGQGQARQTHQTLIQLGRSCKTLAAHLADSPRDGVYARAGQQTKMDLAVSLAGSKAEALCDLNHDWSSWDGVYRGLLLQWHRFFGLPPPRP